ncbi:MFS transporter methylenomycin A resistance protein [Amycolatopsis mediterranei S699]|uniref:MFS transporter, methylenomycin A resistance protein n=2 Tax=Amycolatopsis mediterranei TaxID=33910 RepID=A0A0H3DK10_AMYMU|nr:MFS transporter [Amycolatopsis mediterranei]ADJ50034.1 MFS transporter, methylenomycin A resistance protein [Amycolatopsis mediterranei U32]AEK47031.1 MFS transporter methylenomycin A resistance protein [Amycolatopsis mediterranei S699]AFO81742.1 MFS transporter methylenomycin A resistance protein [Amycolatopsis mediterranei S699]AGT88871.1 MFS transporter methylenomycin A resistance protein [Amycolatopsis mediterranei RB]KDO07717.1 MFS transporter [Amycolatopsis mediterranei]
MARLLAGLSLGYFLVMLDTTIVTVALPALSPSLPAQQWISNGYTLTFAAFLLTAGAWSDRFGARRVFSAGLVSFAALSGLSALSFATPLLIALRALLGVAGALLVPSSLSLIAAAYPVPAARAKAMGVWAAVSGTGLVAGPLLGGLLTEAFGWRAIFLVNVPVAAVAWALSRSAPLSPARPGRIDVVGQLSAVVALSTLTYALIERSWGALLLSAVAAAVFVRSQRHPEAMLPARLFRKRAFPLGLAAGAIVNFGLSGVLFVLSLYFQENRGYPPSATGLAFLPLTIPTAFNPIFTGRLVARSGPRVPAVSGFLLMSAGTLVQAWSTSPAISAVALALLGFGVSLAIPSLLAAVVTAAPPELTGVAGGALNASRQTGAALGVAILGALLTGTTASIALLTAAGVLLAGALVVAAIPAARLVRES